MKRRHTEASIAVTLFAMLMLAGASSAELVDPDMPARRHVQESKLKVFPPTGLGNPELPDRKGVEFWKFKVHAAAKVAETFDSNVYLTDSDTKSDIITLLSPSVGLEMKVGDHRVSADYEVGQYLYGTWQNENHFDHRARALAEIQFTRYKITVIDTFRIYTDRASDENSLRLKENTNDFKAGVSAQFTRYGFDVGYINRLRTYDQHDLSIGSLTWSQRAFTDNSAYAIVTYQWLPKTTLIAQNDIGYIRYYETSQLSDSWYDNVLVGIKGDWTNKFSFNIRGGVRYQHYYDSELLIHKPFIGPVLKGGVEYTPTHHDRILCTVERMNYESTYANMNYYTVNALGIEYRHTFKDKVTGTLFGSYQLHLYPSETTENGTTAKRYDNIYMLGASLRYDMNKWLSFEGRYEYTQKMSMFDIFDYKDHMISLRGTGGV